MVDEGCRLQSWFGDICRSERGTGRMGTAEGYDTRHRFCALADNDSHIYFQPLNEILRIFTKQDLIDALNGTRRVFEREKGCANSVHMIEVIERRIKEVEGY